MPDTEFIDKVAFITGAGSGIGRATALAFAAAGATVVATDLDNETATATADLIGQQGGRALGLACDVTRNDDIVAALNATVDTFGHLDIAFNNAGIEQPVAPLADISENDWDRIVAVNLKSVYLCMKHQIPLLLKAGGGSIVNTSSGAGVIGIRGQSAYTAVKHGVIGMTKSAALDYAATGIRINAICPGIIETPMMGRFSGGTPEGRERVIAQEPVGRMGRPEEIASAVQWLSSDLGAFTTGHALVIDGGQTVGL
ncbi:glucose 1-dehydrogenase [Nocardia sp. 348MFTsu5.1]|uniref:glucose 1-dehydrogenase n=1 Tax=Nocardia sp. 348MFTsu5.1 TaxID=1172185 RepID=UPI00036640BE|nr:glucose 1-dehydrogenase [Nocardia sp. 348MFTsu5.1]